MLDPRFTTLSGIRKGLGNLNFEGKERLGFPENQQTRVRY